MRQLEDDLNFIRSLAPRPAMSTTDLQAEFDKAGNTIKTFINTKLEPDITDDIATCLQTAKSYADNAIADAIGALNLDAEHISYDNTLSGMTADDVQGAIDELKDNEGTLTNGKTAYADFVTTSSSQNYSLSQSSSQTLTFTQTKSGYFPLCISSVQLSTWYGVDTMTPAYFDTQSNGSAVVKMIVAHGNTAASITGTAYVKVLWVKIRS